MKQIEVFLQHCHIHNFVFIILNCGVLDKETSISRSTLENVLELLINEREAAEVMLHDFIAAEARRIHEELLNESDEVVEEDLEDIDESRGRTFEEHQSKRPKQVKLSRTKQRLRTKNSMTKTKNQKTKQLMILEMGDAEIRRGS